MKGIRVQLICVGKMKEKFWLIVKSSWTLE